jgi:hypothetical protein
VHPYFGQTVRVVHRYGAGAIRAETADGKVLLLRSDWTELGESAPPLTVDGQAVRLGPQALRELVRWVDKIVEADPSQGGDRRKVGPGRRLDTSWDHGRGLSAGAGTACRLGGEDRRGGAQDAAGVVEQAGAPTVDGGGPGPRGGV